MTSSITKADLIWFVIRATGFVLVLLAILRLPELLGLAAWKWYVGDSANTTLGTEMAATVAHHMIVSGLLYLVPYGVTGLYLLRRGAWVYSLLDFGTPTRSNISVERDAPEAARPSP